jgi:hypothetical protein
MKTVKLVSLAAATVVAYALTAPSMATTWDFVALGGGVDQPLGSTFTFAQGSESVAAFALAPGGAPGSWTEGTFAASGCGGATANDPCLYAKGAGTPFPSAEHGLGLVPDNDHEIFRPDGIGIVASSAVSAIQITSVQLDESWQVQACSAGFVGCVTVAQGVGGSGGTALVNVSGAALGGGEVFVVDVPCTNKSPCLGGTTDFSNDIMLSSITTGARKVEAPEPATLALFAFALICLGAALRRRAL